MEFMLGVALSPVLTTARISGAPPSGARQSIA